MTQITMYLQATASLVFKPTLSNRTFCGPFDMLWMRSRHPATEHWLLDCPA